MEPSEVVEAAPVDALIAKAIDTIEGLADQQAMPDDFYLAPLADLKAYQQARN